MKEPFHEVWSRSGPSGAVPAASSKASLWIGLVLMAVLLPIRLASRVLEDVA